MWLLLALVSQEAPQKLKFQVEHLNVDAKQAVPLKPEEAKAFAEELKKLAGVKDAACTESVATITLSGEGPLKLSDLRAAGKKTLTYDGGKPVIVFNTLRLEGRVTLTLKVDKNPEKVKDALKDLGWKDVKESDGAWEGTVKSPIDAVSVVRKICAKTGTEYKIFEILKDIAWHPR